jgi:Ca2+-binding EF-hand superfamily protein
MKTLLTLALVALCSIAFNASAAKAGKGKVSDEAKALLEKYDTNKDGKLDKKERAAVSGDDKAKLEAAFPAKKKK